MEKFSFLLKTYNEDFIYVKRLLNSFQRFNLDNIKMYIIFPESQTIEFTEKVDQSLLTNCVVLEEELFDKYLVKEDLYCNLSCTPGYIRPGYINQEIIKLAFYELNYCENYLPLDSDGEFIRPFYYSDFIAKDGNPYSILVEDNELKVDPYYYNMCGWSVRENRIRGICSEINFEPETLLTAHGFCIFNVEVLKNFYENFMNVKKYTYVDLMRISTYEFSWYNMWLQKCKIIPIHIKEPLFKYFHYQGQLEEYKRRGIEIDDIARGYVGIVVNSNFQPNRGIDNPINYNTFVTPPPIYKSYLWRFNKTINCKNFKASSFEEVG